MVAPQETRGRLMRHYRHLSDHPTEDDREPPPHRESEKGIVSVRVKFSNFEHTINEQKQAIQAETRSLLKDSQELTLTEADTTTTTVKTKRNANRKRLGELYIEMDSLSRLLCEETERKDLQIMKLRGEALDIVVVVDQLHS